MSYPLCSNAAMNENKPAKPNHHLWNNNGTYWCHYTVHEADYTKRRGRKLEVHDVDNRLKDILDALQGRMRGSKAVRRFVPIIHNDRQVFRVVITKSLPPKQSLWLGDVSVLHRR
jgi:Holliday junction resolvase RusA-like endonuclease